MAGTVQNTPSLSSVAGSSEWFELPHVVISWPKSASTAEMNLTIAQAE